MKPYFKPPASHLQHAFRASRPALFSLLFTLFFLHASASVPLAWQVTPRNPAPVAFDRHHGETLEFSCTFSGFGELPFGQAADIRLWYQTNGMAAAWWSVPASVSSNVLSATFPPSADPGADRLALFFGAPSNAYASAVLRLRHSPGFAPNILPPPEQATFEETDPVFAAWLAATELVHEEQDPTVPAWAKSPTPPASGLSTNDVCNIVTNEVSIFGQWSFDPVYWDEMYGPPSYSDTSGVWGMSISGSDLYARGGPNATRLEWHYEDDFDGEVQTVSTRNVIMRNALGLARLSDTVQLTTTNDVCEIVTNRVERYGEWTVTPPESDGESYSLTVSTNIYERLQAILDVYYDGEQVGAYDSDGDYPLDSTEISINFGSYYARREVIDSNALGLARLVDLPPLTNGLATAASVAAANTRASNAQNTANSVAATVSAWETYWDGDEVRVTVTNYDSAVQLPSLYIEQKIEDTEDYRVVWDERTRWASNDVQMAEMRSAMDEKADRAWGFYDSHTGNYAPDGYTWLSSPRIAIAGGLAYQRTLTTAGAVWVLSSNGMVAQTGGTEDGFFRIKDDEGNTTFEIVRGNKRTVGATAAGIKVTSPRNSPTTTIEIPYNVTSDVPPTLYGTVSLSSPEWAEISATWTGQSGAWTGTVATSTSTYFIKGTYETGGETYIKNVAPISVESGIYCTDGIHKVRPVYANGAITWEVVQ